MTKLNDDTNNARASTDKRQSVDSGQPNGDTGDAISRWLEIFTRLLHLTSDQSESIREELDSHLRERTRDLMLGGVDEASAIQQSLSELGETTALARRFEKSHHRFRQRRTIMNIATFGVAGAALVAASTFTSVSILNLNDDPRIAIYDQAPTGQSEAEAGLDSMSLSMDFDDTSFGDVIDYISKRTELDVHVHWNQMEFQQIDREYPVTLELHERAFAQAMDLLLSSIDERSEFGWRVKDGLLEIASREYLDQRDRLLVTFEVGDILDSLAGEKNSRSQAAEEVTNLIQSYVEPLAWESNGGQFGRLRIVGNKMFVDAPERFLPPISWILGQLEQDHSSATKSEDNLMGRGIGTGENTASATFESGSPGLLGSGTGTNERRK